MFQIAFASLLFNAFKWTLVFVSHYKHISDIDTWRKIKKNASLSPFDLILEGFYTIAHSEHESILSSQGYHEPSRPI